METGKIHGTGLCFATACEGLSGFSLGVSAFVLAMNPSKGAPESVATR